MSNLKIKKATFKGGRIWVRLEDGTRLCLIDRSYAPIEITCTAQDIIGLTLNEALKVAKNDRDRD